MSNETNASDEFEEDIQVGTESTSNGTVEQIECDEAGKGQFASEEDSSKSSSYGAMSDTKGSSIEEVTGLRQFDQKHPCGYMKFLRSLDPIVLDVIYWHNRQSTAAVFGFLLLFLFTVGINPLLHTVVLLLLATMVVSLFYCVGKVLWDSFYNREVENPFRAQLQRDSVVSQQAILDVSKILAERIDYCSLLLFQLILFYNVKASLKFGLALWIASYFTPYLTIFTSALIVLIFLFTIPKAYETYEAPVDKYIGMALCKLHSTMEKVQSKLPFGKAKEE